MPSPGCEAGVAVAATAALMLLHVPPALFLGLDSVVSCMQVRQTLVMRRPMATHAMTATQTQPGMCATQTWHVLVRYSYEQKLNVCLLNFEIQFTSRITAGVHCSDLTALH